MQFGGCFSRFQLGALRCRRYVGKDTGQRDSHVQHGALQNVGPSESFGLILNDLGIHYFTLFWKIDFGN